MTLARKGKGGKEQYWVLGKGSNFLIIMAGTSSHWNMSSLCLLPRSGKTGQRRRGDWEERVTKLPRSG